MAAVRSASAAPMTPARTPGCAHRACWIEEAHVTELTGLLREGPAGTSCGPGPRRCGSSRAASGRIRARS